jgi:hypothetical protein
VELTMSINKFLPSAPEISREALIVLCGTVLAAWVISRVPALQQFVLSSSVTVKDGGGKTLW